jgi:hypothetical protein
MRRPSLSTLVAFLAFAAPGRTHGQVVNPGLWRPVPEAVTDTMSERALLRLHRRLLAHEDSLLRYGAYLVRHGVPWRPRRDAHPPLSTSTYAALMGTALLYNATCPFGRTVCERDAGGYDDGYRSIDKLAHASTALALTSLAVQGGVRPRDAALVTVAASVGFELTQAQGGGYYSGRDVVANATGVAVAWGWSAWVERRRAPTARSRRA